MTTEFWIGTAFRGLGELGCALELLLGTVAAVAGCVGVLLCLKGMDGRPETAFVDREYSRADEDRTMSVTTRPGKAEYVTIRLEPKCFRLFRRSRCIVTIRRAKTADSCR
jgi:hypothetical protein